MKKTVKKPAKRKPAAVRRLEKKLAVAREDNLLLTKDNIALRGGLEKVQLNETELKYQLAQSVGVCDQFEKRNIDLHARNRNLKDANNAERRDHDRLNAGLKMEILQTNRRLTDLQEDLERARRTGALYAALYLGADDELGPAGKIQDFHAIAERSGSPVEVLGEEPLKAHSDGSVIFTEVFSKFLRDSEKEPRGTNVRAVGLEELSKILSEALSARAGR